MRFAEIMSPRPKIDSSITIEPLTYAELRRRFVVVDHDATDGILRVLLRLEDCERSTTRHVLEGLGFEPSAGPPDRSIGWIARIDADKLEALSTRLVEALGGRMDVVLDVGACFAFHGREATLVAETEALLPAFWPGRFLLHVGGTRRCIIFDRGAAPAEVARVFVTERDAYEHDDFHPLTE